MPKIKKKTLSCKSRENLALGSNKSKIADRELEKTENLAESNLDGDASINMSTK